jgi:AcrR family transcriptional regulator
MSVAQPRSDTLARIGRSGMTAPRFRPPQQTRSQATLDRILDAAESVLEEKSFGEATLAEIMDRAGVTVGAFYRRFPDKDALLHLLDNRFFAELHELAQTSLGEAKWEDATVPQIVHEFTSSAVQLYRERRGLLRSLFLRARTDPVIMQSAREVNAHYIDRLRTLLLARADQVRHPSPERAVELGFMILIGALRETVLFGEVWPNAQRVVDEGLAKELARAYLAYLGAPLT